MGVIEDIKRMQGDGRSESEIRKTLRSRGVSLKEINEGISQAEIKDAVFSNEDSAIPGLPEVDEVRYANGGDLQELPPTPSPSERESEQSAEFVAPDPGVPSEEIGKVERAGGPLPWESSQHPVNKEYEGMQPSILVQEQQPQEYSAPFFPGQEYEAVSGGSEYPASAEQQYAADVYQQYQPYQEAMSSDIITEISEQVVSERLAALQNTLEKAVDFRTVADAKLSSLHERLQRIEKIIDRLQLSLLQKVGDYVGDVQDIKRELEETQKSFRAIKGNRVSHHKTHAKKKTQQK